MATEDTETEAGGQTEDTGDSGGEEASTESDGETQQAKPEKGAPGARDKRRGDKYREANEGRQRAEQQLSEVQGRYASLERSFNEFREQIEKDKREAQQSNASTETKQKVSSLRQQARGYLVASANEKDPARAQQLLDKHDELMDEADDMRRQMRDDQNWTKRRDELRGEMPNPEYQREMSYLEAKYPHVMNSRKAMALADQHYIELVQGGTRQAGRATLEEAITWAAKTLGLGGRGTAANPYSRQVYGGRGAGDGEMDDSAPSGSMSVEEVKNNLAFKRMAQLTYPQDEPEVAYAKWAKGQGSPAKNGAGAR